jgi:hypothetical protein
MKILIRNLPRSTTQAEVQALFEAHGKVQSCTLVMDSKTGESKGFGFVEMPKPGHARAAMKSLNGTEIAGNRIRVKKAEPKTVTPKAEETPDNARLIPETPTTKSRNVFEELDFQSTPLGDISLRRRSEPKLNHAIVYEVKLGDEFLMSSLFTESEIQLARLGLAALKSGPAYSGGSEPCFDIVVGGLGLGYTAHAVLEDPAVRSLQVIDIMQPVIGWHRQGLVPLGKALVDDPRCRLVHADFFALAGAQDNYFNGQHHDQPVHAVLLDIDHSPTHWLNEGNQSFYTSPSLQHLAEKIHPGGAFGLWSNDPPDDNVTSLLESVFRTCQSHVVTFPNPYTGKDASCTVYIASKAGE